MKRSSIDMNLYVDCFLKPEKSFADASNLAYVDMARHTLRVTYSDGKKIEDKIKKAIDESLTKRKKIIRDNITKELLAWIKKLPNQKSYNDWHGLVSDYLVNQYSPSFDVIDESNNNYCVKLKFEYGQAQKWLNMLIKYLYVYDVKENETDQNTIFENYIGEDLIPFLHIPVDTIVYQMAKDLNCDNKSFFEKISKKAWSNLDKKEYTDFQDKLKNALKSSETEDDKIPFYWEMKNWANPKYHV